MVTTITKSYHKFFEKTHYNLYGLPGFKDTNVFHEYYGIILDLDLRCEELKEFVRTFKPTSKSRISVYLEDTRILFCKPNRSVFPVFYIQFK